MLNYKRIVGEYKIQNLYRHSKGIFEDNHERKEYIQYYSYSRKEESHRCSIFFEKPTENLIVKKELGPSKKVS